MKADAGVSAEPLFPVFLKLAGRDVLVVGGGLVAAAKIRAVQEAGASVTVVAPDVVPDIAAAAVRIVRRGFRASDLDGISFVIAAATPPVNRVVARAAERRRLFVNAVDDPSNATAYLGGVLRRDSVTIAISTSGRAPALAGLLREAFDALLPSDLDRWLARADVLRRRWRKTSTPMAGRRPQLLAALDRLYAARRRGVGSGVQL
ncbi:MAG TPA: bifunctional precorrin-2 dehydrogenase/sirohydrochlorin ferrochelatase [Vicinamibacterales bacterium]|nr:bifunctional precorrin-2 dehydrogenase/sirohydrochlorin ferrochelatase [Vicinamibacterales bacterium]